MESVLNPERVRQLPKPFQGLIAIFEIYVPGFSLHSNPGLELANAFGVHIHKRAGPGTSYRRSRNEASFNIFLRPDQSLNVVCYAGDAAGRMSRQSASDHVDTWSENDWTLSAAALWWDQAQPESLG